MRKSTLAICTSLAVLGVVGFSAQSALAANEPIGECVDGNLANGIYNNAWQKDKFDLVNANSGLPSDPTGKANTPDGFAGTINLCGTDGAGANGGTYFYTGGFVTPAGVTIRCTNPSITDSLAKAYCNKQVKAGNKLLPNYDLVGGGTAQTWTTEILGGMQLPDTDLVTTIANQGKSYYKDRKKVTNAPVQTHCTGKAIACQRIEANLIGVAVCGSDIVWTLHTEPLDAVARRFDMTGYAPTCSHIVGLDPNPLFVDGIPNLDGCAYASSNVDGQKCGGEDGQPKDATLWIAKNGNAGCYSGAAGYTLKTTMATVKNRKAVKTGAGPSAVTTKAVCWTA